jgi:hypothetical protein
MSRKSKTFQEMFGADAACLAAMLHLVSLTKGYEDGPFKAGFESAIEEVGAFLDSEAGDGGTQSQTLMEQMLGLVNGSYALTEIKGPIGVVANQADDLSKEFIKSLIWQIENSQVQTHIRHDGDRKSRPINMSVQESDVPNILSALRRC